MRDKRNYLDFVPVKNPQLPWQEDEGAIVTVEVTHRGLAAKVAQIAFNRPQIYKRTFPFESGDKFEFFLCGFNAEFVLPFPPCG